MECEFASCEWSSEVDAELQRSTKKVKEDQPLDSSQGGGGACGTLSYKAKLVGDILGVYAQAFKFRVDEEEEPYSDKEVDDPLEGTVAIKLCFSCGGMGHRKSHCPYIVKEMVVDTDNADMSDQGGKDVEVEAISNPEETDAGKDRGD